MPTNAINHRGGPVAEVFDDAAFWPCGRWCVSAWSRSLLPCLVVLKLKDWKPPASAEESMTSTPYSLWFFLYSMTATTRIATAMIPAPRPEYRATSLEPSMSEAHEKRRDLVNCHMRVSNG